MPSNCPIKSYNYQYYVPSDTVLWEGHITSVVHSHMFVALVQSCENIRQTYMVEPSIN